MDKPTISIVTVCYNAADTIEETIKSVLNQTYDNVEYLIIDGGSTDRTVDIIKKYDDRISYWISEPDKGIYDAMNKGIAIASGDYIGFINSGDKYADRHVIALVVEQLLNTAPDIIYGDIVLKYSFGRYYTKPLPLNTFKTGFPFSHPSSFVRLQLLKNELFDTSYKIVADYNFFLKMYDNHKEFVYFSTPIAEFEAETGVSSMNVLPTFIEISKVNGTKGINLRWLKVFATLIIKDYVRQFMRKKYPHIYEKYIKHALEKKHYISRLN